MASHRVSRLVFALAALGALPAQAGDYSFISTGFQLGVGQALSTTKYGLRDADGKPLGLGDPMLYNAGLVFQVRLGEVAGPLRDFTFQVYAGVDAGSKHESSSLSNTQVVVGGTTTTMVDVSVSQKTTQQDYYFAIPLRWYPGIKGNQMEGFWIEAGPGWVRQNQKNDLSLSGTVLANPITVSDSIRYTQTKFAWNMGLGWARQYDKSTFNFGVQYRAIRDTGVLPDNGARLILQWTF